MVDVREWLYLYPRIDREINEFHAELLKTLQMKRDVQDTLSAQRLTDMPHGTEVGDPTGMAVMRSIGCYDTHIRYLNGKLSEMFTIKRVVEAGLKVLNDEQKSAVDVMFFRCKKVDDVCADLYVGRSRAYKVLQDAIDKIMDCARQQAKGEQHGMDAC